MQENTIKSAQIPSTTTTSNNNNGGGGNAAAAAAGITTATSNITTTSSSSPSNANDIDQAQFEADKRAVYKHPLFSLLALLLEKCEQATLGYVSNSSSSNSSSRSSPNGSSNGNCENDSFSRDVQAFVQLLEKEKRPLLTNNAELDGLMIKALQVLRIHLLELEKVQELCRDFCTRYIACLRGKMQSENLLRSDYALEHNNNLSNSNSPVNSPEQDGLSSQHGPFYGNQDFLSNSDAPSDFSSTTTPSNQFLVHHNGGAGGGASQHLETDLSMAAAGHALSHQILGTTPLSQIGCAPVSAVTIPEQYAAQLSPCNSSDELDDDDDDLGSNFSNNSGGKRQKRGILPKQATSVMRAWLFQHLVHPYPTEDEKRTIAAQTNLTLLQVNNWFINARRRILQPMLEHASDNSGQSPANSEKRYWPEQSSGAPGTVNSSNDPNIENISGNINRADRRSNSFYSSEESNDGSLVIDQDN
ncbi:homeobox protein PKNOX2-like [Culicoides brevitarsis]|uniref:homeobox protein PKNOX2-like n=1 Tax=Culicoides brevitarsis TaxID=469753 RepID=UPI00307B5DA6